MRRSLILIVALVLMVCAAHADATQVEFTGVLKQARPAVTTLGTHVLVAETTKLIVLESDKVDLNHYLNRKVTVRGHIVPTDQENALLIHVEEVQPVP